MTLQFVRVDDPGDRAAPVWRHAVIDDPDETLALVDAGPWPFVWSPHRRHRRKLERARAEAHSRWQAARIATLTLEACTIELKRWADGPCSVWVGSCVHGYVAYSGSLSLARVAMAPQLAAERRAEAEARMAEMERRRADPLGWLR